MKMFSWDEEMVIGIGIVVVGLWYLVGVINPDLYIEICSWCIVGMCFGVPVIFLTFLVLGADTKNGR
jgi:hypothetical protein